MILRNILSTILLIIIFSLAGCQANHTTAQSDAGKSSVILISLDGFRYDYLEKYTTPNLTALAKRGVRSEALISVFPSKTFANHYSIITGLYPAHHGIISNQFWDPEYQKAFSYKDSNANKDSHWWGGEPLWNTVEKQNIKAASFFWPGSEALIQGHRASLWKRYNGAVRNYDRIDTVLSWLTLPQNLKPRFIATYFSITDEVGHEFGPESQEMRRAVMHVDSVIGSLVEGIDRMGLSEQVNIILVSDHGMATVLPDSLIFLDDMIDVNSVRILNETPFVGIWTKNGNVDEVYKTLVNKHPRMQVYTRENVPARFKFKGNPRIPEIICLTEPPWSITTRDYAKRHKDKWLYGSHGFDPEIKEMGGLFIASGPAFEKGKIIPSFENIHIYALVCHILGITPSANDGDINVFKSAIK
ncbi:MAG TPA: ectonucleotide pyrophosphatase/phosphodiesterase [bacterium]|nr:ectonucleotide pyrophosphatase/phosphodiesterase [bacterium]